MPHPLLVHSALTLPFHPCVCKVGVVLFLDVACMHTIITLNLYTYLVVEAWHATPPNEVPHVTMLSDQLLTSL